MGHVAAATPPDVRVLCGPLTLRSPVLARPRARRPLVSGARMFLAEASPLSSSSGQNLCRPVTSAYQHRLWRSRCVAQFSADGRTAIPSGGLCLLPHHIHRQLPNSQAPLDPPALSEGSTNIGTSVQAFILHLRVARSSRDALREQAARRANRREALSLAAAGCMEACTDESSAKCSVEGAHEGARSRRSGERAR